MPYPRERMRLSGLPRIIGGPAGNAGPAVLSRSMPHVVIIFIDKIGSVRGFTRHILVPTSASPGQGKEFSCRSRRFNVPAHDERVEQTVTLRKWSLASTPVLFLLLPVFLAAIPFRGPSAASASEIRIAGTGSALGAMRHLAEAFRAEYPGVRIVVFPSLGSSGGIEALLAGRIDVAISARPLTPAEMARGCREVLLARTPLVFAVQRSVKVCSLTPGEIAAIYGGEMSRWPNGTRIRPILRPPSEIDMAFLKEMSPEMKTAVERAMRREGISMATTDQDAADAIERTPGAFGAMTLALALSERRSVRILAMGESKPSVEALAAGSYPYAKSFYVVTREKESPAVVRFLNFARSPAASRVLRKNGCLPFPWKGRAP
jgi:phosphate transport system substrate-binding protein